MTVKSYSISLLLSIGLLAGLLSACGASHANGGAPHPTHTPAATSLPATGEPNNSGQTPAAVSHGGPITDYVSLIDNLRAAGARVDAAGEVTQPFFSVKGQVIKANGAEVQVFGYADGANAKSAASKVALDGSSVGTSMVTWVEPPHFYQVGDVIVLYVGSDMTVTTLLTHVLGPQFAGR